MKHTKHILWVLLLGMLVSFASGCNTQGKITDQGQVTTGQPTESAIRNSENTTESKWTPNLEKKMKFSINLLRVKEVSESPLYDFFTKKFNVEFDIIPHTKGDWDEKARIWIATADMPDVLYWGLKDTNFNEYRRYVSQDAFKALPELKDKYPNLHNTVNSLKSLKYMKFDGNLYCLPATRDRDFRNNTNNQGFIYRKDWAVKLGMYRDEYTWDDFVALAKAFMDKDPGGNGSGKTIGMTGIAWSFPIAFGLQQHNPHVEQYVLDKESGKYVWGPTLPETLAGIKEEKKLYDSGILWQDILIASGKDGIDKFVAGQTGICYSNWDVNNLETQLYNKFPSIKVVVDGMSVEEAVAFMPVLSPDGTIWAMQNADWFTALLFNPQLGDEKLERFLYMFDWLASEEGFHFRTKGIPGEHWDYVDGNAVLKWERDENGVPIRPYDIYAMELYDRVGASESYNHEDETIPKFIKDMDKTILKRTMQENVRLNAVDYPALLFSGTNFDKYGRFTVELQNKIKELIVVNKMDEVDKLWSDWLKTMEPKVKLVLDELNESLVK